MIFALSHPIVALVYDDGATVEPVLSRIVTALRARDLRIAGFLQHDRARADRTRCDMYLEDLASGALVAISEDRGANARGCRLDHDAMARAESLCAISLDAAPDLLVINKFGKTEGEGGGFRPLMARALAGGVPVLIAVPRRNLDAWRAFSAGMSREIDVNDLPANGDALAARLAPETTSPA